MSAAPYWIQGSDLSHKDFPVSGALDIAEALFAHNWAGEAARRRNRIDNGEEECPAGLGIIAKDDRQLIIRPDGEGRCEIEYSFFESSKAFGLIPQRKYHAGELKNAPLDVAKSLIAPFLDNDYGAAKIDIQSCP